MKPNQLFEESINRLELSVRVANFLNNKGYQTIGELVGAEPGAFVLNGGTPKIRKRIEDEIDEALAQFGLSLDMELDPKVAQELSANRLARESKNRKRAERAWKQIFDRAESEKNG